VLLNTILNTMKQLVSLLNTMKQLVSYVTQYHEAVGVICSNERLTELVERGGILTQTQGGFRQDKSTDINTWKLYGLTKETQEEMWCSFCCLL